MCRFLLLVLLFLLPAGQAPAAAPGEEGVVSSSDLTYFRNSGPIVYSDASYSGLESLRKGHADTAYAIWVKEGLQGDIDALALAGMLCRMEEKKSSAGWKIRFGQGGDAPPPPVCPVPAQFWEDSLIAMLGEGEATFLLGLFGMELMEYDPHRIKMDYGPPVEEYLLRSARTGHSDGMYGAYLTGENRPDTGFIPPPELPDLPVLPKKFEPECTYEGRYWLTHAAHAGNLFAMNGMSWRYRKTDTPDARKVAYYYEMATKHGSDEDPRILALLYAKGNVLPQNCVQSIYYGAIATRLLEQGKIVLDDDERYHFGTVLNDYKQGFMRGDFTLGGKRVVTKPCLTEEEFAEAVERSIPAYEAAKAAKDRDRARHVALYEAARKKLPEIRAAYEKAITARTQ